MHGAKLEIPAFTQGKTQLSAKDVHTTRTIANVHIHVIGHVHSKYTIFYGPLPVDYLSKCGAKEVPLIDIIVPLCCSLCSLSESVGPFG